MEDSIFTKIIKGDIPCHKVHEDKHTLALMDINPIQPGMLLVIPKQQIDHFMDMPDEVYLAVMLTVKQAALKLREVFPGKRIGVIIEGFDVPHAHVKLLPISSGQDLRTLPEAAEPDHPALAEMAKRLAF